MIEKVADDGLGPVTHFKKCVPRRNNEASSDNRKQSTTSRILTKVKQRSF